MLTSCQKSFTGRHSNNFFVKATVKPLTILPVLAALMEANGSSIKCSLINDTAPLQRVQNAIARLVARRGPRDHMTPTLTDRHWLPVEQRIVFKLCLLMHQVHTERAQSYLCNCFAASADITSRPLLRSTSAPCGLGGVVE